MKGYRLLGSRVCPIERSHCRWSWVTLVTSNAPIFTI